MTALADEYSALMRDRCLIHAGVATRSWGIDARRGALRAGAGRLEALRRTRGWACRARSGASEGLRRARSPRSRPWPSSPAPWGRDVGAEALIAIADLARDAEGQGREREALLRAVVAPPAVALAEQAETRLKGVAQLPVERPGRPRPRRSSRRTATSRGSTVLEPLLPSSSCRSRSPAARTSPTARRCARSAQHTKAIAALAPVVEKCTDPDLRAARALRARLVAVDRRTGARRRRPTSALAREFPDHSFADDALFYAADLYVKTGSRTQALAAARGAGERYPRATSGRGAVQVLLDPRARRGERDDGAGACSTHREAVRRRGRDLRGGAGAVLAGADAAGARETRRARRRSSRARAWSTRPPTTA